MKHSTNAIRLVSIVGRYRDVRPTAADVHSEPHGPSNPHTILLANTNSFTGIDPKPARRGRRHRRSQPARCLRSSLA